eukprot:scaffold82793_cov22-Prasinocladus_malaysianus.AAC.1
MFREKDPVNSTKSAADAIVHDRMRHIYVMSLLTEGCLDVNGKQNVQWQQHAWLRQMIGVSFQEQCQGQAV